MLRASSTLCDRRQPGPQTCSRLAAHADTEASEENLLTRYEVGKRRNVLTIFLEIVDILRDTTIKLDGQVDHFERLVAICYPKPYQCNFHSELHYIKWSIRHFRNGVFF